MTVVLTGATGLVGSAVLRALLGAGYDVTALVRSESSAATVRAAGATAAVGDLGDAGWVREQIAGSDGVIHAASPGDASSAEFDTAFATAALDALAGSGRPYVHTGGIWVYGPGTDITEADDFAAPTLTAWRAAVEDLILTADGIRTAVVVPAVVYGSGQGLPALLTTPAEDGTFHTVGDGEQHWTLVHADDLADLYLRVFRTDNATGYYIGAGPHVSTVREIAATAADVAGAQVVTETAEESRGRLGDLLADALLLDQIAGRGRAIDELGWDAKAPSLEYEIRQGSYAPHA